MTLPKGLAGFLRVLGAFVVFSVVAQGLAPAVSSPLLRVVLGLVAMVVVLALADVVRSRVGHDGPAFGEGSFLRSSVGVAALVAFILVGSLLAEWLTSRLASPNWFVTGSAFVVAGAAVFGSLVGYYWWRESTTPAD